MRARLASLRPRASRWSAQSSTPKLLVLAVYPMVIACSDDSATSDAATSDAGAFDARITRSDGEVDSGTSDGGTSGIGGEIHRAFAEAYCEVLTGCQTWGTAEIGAEVHYRNTLRPCIEVALAELEGPRRRGALIAGAVATGAAIYDPAGARACLDAAVAQCDGSSLHEGAFELIDDPACVAVVEGLRGAGDSCGWYSCAPSYACSANFVTCGVCIEQTIALGEPCRNDAECAPASPVGVARCAAVSPASPSDNRCREVRIVADRRLDETCGQLSLDEHVVTVGRCGRGLWCEWPPSTSAPETARTGTCRAPTALGAPCASRQERCVRDAGCIGSVCTALRIETRAGSPCDEAAGIACDIFNGLSCEAGLCELVGDRTERARCRDHFDCGTELYCGAAGTPAERTCARRLTTGEPCSDANACTFSCAGGRCAGPCP